MSHSCIHSNTKPCFFKSPLIAHAVGLRPLVPTPRRPRVKEQKSINIYAILAIRPHYHCRMRQLTACATMYLASSECAAVAHSMFLRPDRSRRIVNEPLAKAGKSHGALWQPCFHELQRSCRSPHHARTSRATCHERGSSSRARGGTGSRAWWSPA